MGLNDAAAASAGAAKFSDVASDDWASGYINVAVSQGILTGYPDGTYKPNDTISYSEAITIIVRMLGYKPVLDGKPWPGAYVAKANETGVTTGVVLSPSVGVSRGNVAKLMSNTLGASLLKLDSYTADGMAVYKESTETLESKLLTKKAVSPTAIETTTTPAVTTTGTAVTSTAAAIETETTKDDTPTSSSSHHHHNNSPSGPTTPTFTVAGNSVHDGNDTIVLTFSEAMDINTLTQGGIRMGSDLQINSCDDQSGTNPFHIGPYNATADWTGNTVLTVTLDEYSYLQNGKYLRISMPTGTAKSAAGVAVSNANVYAANPIDGKAPILTNCVIDSVSSPTAITLTFDEKVDASTLTTLSGIRLQNGSTYYSFSNSTATNSGSAKTIVITLDGGNTALYTDRAAVWSGFNTGSVVLVSAGAIKDVGGSACGNTSHGY